MGISLAKMAANTARVTFQYEGDSITVVYYPNKLTDKLIAQSDTGMEGQNQAIAQLIKSWDVYEDEEETVMFPLEAGRLGEIGVAFKSAVILALIEDMRPNKVAAQI